MYPRQFGLSRPSARPALLSRPFKAASRYQANGGLTRIYRS